MITDFLLFLFSGFVRLIAYILPSWLIWPDIVQEIFLYVVDVLAQLNFIIPLFDEVFPPVRFLVWFQSLYWGWKIAAMFVNYVRGASGINV